MILAKDHPGQNSRTGCSSVSDTPGSVLDTPGSVLDTPGGVLDTPGSEPLRARRHALTLPRLRGGLVFKTHRFLYRSTLGSRVIQKREEKNLSTLTPRETPTGVSQGCPRVLARVVLGKDHVSSTHLGVSNTLTDVANTPPCTG